MCPNWRPNAQPRHVPWRGIDPTTFWFAAWCLTNWATSGSGLGHPFCSPCIMQCKMLSCSIFPSYRAGSCLAWGRRGKSMLGVQNKPEDPMEMESLQKATQGWLWQRVIKTPYCLQTEMSSIKTISLSSMKYSAQGRFQRDENVLALFCVKENVNKLFSDRNKGRC